MTTLVFACAPSQPPQLPIETSEPTWPPSLPQTQVAATKTAEQPKEPPLLPDYPCEPFHPEEDNSAGSHNKSSRDRAKRDEKKPPRGTIDPYLIQNIIRTNYGKFRSCYEEGLRTNPNLNGRVTVRFVIELNGEVKDAQPVCTTSMPDREVVRCVTEGYRTLTFPRPEGGIVTVVYPIIFTPGD